MAHISFGDPVCGELAKVVEGACKKEGIAGKLGGTYVCMEGPQFSTKAESNVYRSWGADVIGMTNLQEAKLAREAEICYVTIAMVTDYDCWHPHHDSVTVDQIVSVLVKNAENAAKVVRATVTAMPAGTVLQVRISVGARNSYGPDQNSTRDKRKAPPHLGEISEIVDGVPSACTASRRPVLRLSRSRRLMSILVVGSVAFDTIATPSGQVKDILGGAATYFSLAASYFTEVRMVAVVGEDFARQHEAVLKNRGVDTRGIERTPGRRSAGVANISIT